MHIFKLALPLAGMLLAGQALAHKAPRFAAMTLARARPVPLQTGAKPAALLGGMAGRATRGMPAALGMMLPQLPSEAPKQTTVVNRRH